MKRLVKVLDSIMDILQQNSNTNTLPRVKAKMKESVEQAESQCYVTSFAVVNAAVWQNYVS